MFTSKKVVNKIQNRGISGFVRDTTELGEILFKWSHLKAEAQISKIGVINRDGLKERADKLEYYDQAEHHKIDYDRAKSLPINLSEQPKEFVLEKPFVASLKNAKITGDSGIVLFNEKLVLEPYLANRSVLTRKLVLSGDIDILPDIKQISTNKIIDTACPLIHWNAPSATGYYGWMCRYLLSLQGLEQWSGKAPTLIIPANPPEWMIESLELLGYNSDDWIEWNTTKDPILVKNLVIPIHRKKERVVPIQIDLLNNHILNKHYDREISSNACRWLRNRYKSQINFESSETRIFISRQNARTRSIANLDEVAPILEDFGFDAIKLENLPLSKQMKLFLKADIVVGAHGAGFSNLIVSQNASVLEIFGNTTLPTYFILSNVLDHDYECMQAEEDESGRIHVDIDELENKLETL
jgi:hypothetical protein